MTTQQQKVQVLDKGQKQVCNSFIDQSYLLSKYQTLKSDTKEIVNEYFLKLKQNIIILSNTRYIQKIERSQRRFDSKSFIDYVTGKATTNEKLSYKEVLAQINCFYKQIKVVELKPFDDKLESEKEKLKKEKKQMPNNNDNSNLPSMSVLSQMIQTTMQNKGIDQSRVQSLLNEDANGKTLNYQILYKLLESAVEEFILINNGNPLADDFRNRVLDKMSDVVNMLTGNQPPNNS